MQGLQALIAQVLGADASMGRKRPGETAALLAALDAKSVDARRLRLARGCVAAAAGRAADYREEIAAPLARLDQFRKWLENIRNLDGPTPSS